MGKRKLHWTVFLGRCSSAAFAVRRLPSAVRTATPVVGPFPQPAQRPAVTRYQTTCEIRHVPLTVFAATWKLFFSRFTTIHNALEDLRLCAIYKPSANNDIDIDIHRRRRHEIRRNTTQNVEAYSVLSPLRQGILGSALGSPAGSLFRCILGIDLHPFDCLMTNDFLYLLSIKKQFPWHICNSLSWPKKRFRAHNLATVRGL